jgi:hypothetical protein
MVVDFSHKFGGQVFVLPSKFYFQCVLFYNPVGTATVFLCNLYV